jgi:hypothetical protein
VKNVPEKMKFLTQKLKPAPKAKLVLPDWISRFQIFHPAQTGIVRATEYCDDSKGHSGFVRQFPIRRLEVDCHHEAFLT